VSRAPHCPSLPLVPRPRPACCLCADNHHPLVPTHGAPPLVAHLQHTCGAPRPATSPGRAGHALGTHARSPFLPGFNARSCTHGVTVVGHWAMAAVDTTPTRFRTPVLLPSQPSRACAFWRENAPAHARTRARASGGPLLNQRRSSRPSLQTLPSRLPARNSTRLAPASTPRADIAACGGRAPPGPFDGPLENCPRTPQAAYKRVSFSTRRRTHGRPALCALLCTRGSVAQLATAARRRQLSHPTHDAPPTVSADATKRAARLARAAGCV
jgi:hypothetical protein